MPTSWDHYRKVLVSGWWEPRTGGFEGHHVEWSKAQRWLDNAEAVGAIVHSWSSDEGVQAFDERVSLRAEVDRLRGILEATARWVRDAGHPVKAGVLRRELNGPDRQ